MPGPDPAVGSVLTCQEAGAGGTSATPTEGTAGEHPVLLFSRNNSSVGPLLKSF